MKKVLLSAFALIFAMAVSADIEIGTVTNSSNLGTCTTDSLIGSTDNVSWLVGACSWSSTGSGSLYINGSTNATSFSKTGTSGGTNPSMGTITRTDGGSDIKQGLPTSGSYHKFTVSADGYLYLVGKMSTKKNYIAYEGSNRIPFYWVTYDEKASGVVSVDLAKQTGLLSKDNNSYIANDSTVQTLGTYLTRQGLVASTSYTDGDETDAIARIAVKKDSTYTFCGTGTNVAIFGFIFAPAGQEMSIVYTTNSTDYTLVGETVPSTPESVTEANWDWENYNPATINYVEDINRTTGYLDSDVDGVKMYVDATNGKIHANSGNVQFNVGTKLYVPVVSEGDKVIVKGYVNGTQGVEYTVGGGETIKSTETSESSYEAIEDDVNAGYVAIVCTGGDMAYLYSVKVEYASQEEEITWSSLAVVENVNDESGEKGYTELTTEDNNLKVTFTDTTYDNAADVTVIDDADAEYYSYITVGTNETKYAISAVNGDEGTAAASTWILTIPEEAMELIADSVAADAESDDDGVGYASATLVIVAQDSEGNYVQKSTTGTFPTYNCTFTTPSEETEIPYTFIIDPTDSDPVESLPEFTVTIDESDEDAYFTIAEGADLSDIKVYSIDDTEYTDALAYVASSDAKEENLTSVTFTLNKEITDEGTYKVVIPAGFFLCGGSETNPSVVTYGYIVVEQSVEYSLTITPADGATISSLSSIIIEEANGQELALMGYEEDIIVYDEDNKQITTGASGAIDIDNPDEDENTLMENGVVYGYIIPLDNVITTDGKYTIVIPEDFVSYGEGSSDSNGEITIKVTVSSLATGIKGVTLQATGDDKFYNISGQRVTSPRNGVYILNGKKILIK